MDSYVPITRSGRGYGGELEIIQYPLYKITFDKIKGLEDILFTQSTYLITWPEVAAAFKPQGAILQSAQEAAAFEIAVGGRIDYLHERQLTRTTALYFRKGSKYFVAFDDIPDESKNIALSVGFSYFKKSRTESGEYRPAEQIICLPLSDKSVQEAIERAEHDSRLIELPTGLKNGMPQGVQRIFLKQIQDIVNNPFLNAVFGRVREEYVEYIKRFYRPKDYSPEEKFEDTFNIIFVDQNWFDGVQKKYGRSEKSALIMTVASGRSISNRTDVSIVHPPAEEVYGVFYIGHGRGVKNSPGFLR